jgi:Protein tyrosine and serine/threonine kinase
MLCLFYFIVRDVNLQLSVFELQNEWTVKLPTGAIYGCLSVLATDMNNQTVLTQITANEYRMPRPVGVGIVCPDELYDIMLNCWNRQADSRPTFEYLRTLFEDFYISTSPSYDEQRP